MIGIEWIIAYLALGLLVGFMAGLLGIGGGGTMVPILTALFLAQGLPTQQVVHLALGTSMGSIILTSVSSMRAHHARGGVRWDIVKTMAPGILVGTFAATFLATLLSAKALAIFFACFMAYSSLQMFLNKQPKPSSSIKGKGELLTVGTGIGGVSALVSIGGGTLTVPYLTWRNIPITTAIGTSAAMGLPISLAGTLGYVINGYGSANDLGYSLGFVYLPAVVLISMMSVLMAPIGAKAAHKLPVPALKKIFALLLILLAAKMLTSVI